MKKICAITMARNDEFFLNKWIEYYGAQFGEENLYVFLDGEDQKIPSGAGKANIVKRRRVSEEMTKADRTRIAFLSEFAAGQFEKGYDLVIGCDADEYLVVDPICGKSLREYLDSLKISVSVSGLGMDVGQKIGEEAALDASRPFLSQRKYALLDSQYTKPVVISRPVRWGAGFHRIKNHDYHIDKNLYLFHFGSADEAIYNSKFSDPERIGEGWTKHMEQRRRTMYLLYSKKIRDKEGYIRFARFLQRTVRHPGQLLRPCMYFWKLVVHIPKRFETSV